MIHGCVVDCAGAPGTDGGVAAAIRGSNSGREEESPDRVCRGEWAGSSIRDQSFASAGGAGAADHVCRANAPLRSGRATGGAGHAVGSVRSRVRTASQSPIAGALLAALEKTAHSRGSKGEGRVVGVERGDDRSVVGSDAVGGIGSPKTSGTVTPAPRDAAAHLCRAGRSPPDSSVEAAPSKNVAIPERSVRGGPVGDNQLAGRRT